MGQIKNQEGLKIGMYSKLKKCFKINQCLDTTLPEAPI